MGTHSPWTHRPYACSGCVVDDNTAKAIRKRFGQRIRDLRGKAGLSQEELADLAGLDRSYIGGVERGERNVSLINIHKIARALKLKPGDLFP
jgi:DNA-binding XRE family transcriptional regulator